MIVNRIWQHHFGRGIVRSPNDFGLKGEAPTHPELLDHLASEFVAGGWRMKSLHRLVMLSSAYRLSSQQTPAAYEKDPKNDYLWRFDPRRLSADEIGNFAVEDRTHVKNLHATILHLMGLDPNRLSYFYSGLDQRLVGVEGAEPIWKIMA